MARFCQHSCRLLDEPERAGVLVEDALVGRSFEQASRSYETDVVCSAAELEVHSAEDVLDKSCARVVVTNRH